LQFFHLFHASQYKNMNNFLILPITKNYLAIVMFW